MSPLPTIHLNGTSAQTLAEDYSNARIAVHKAYEALQKVEFHSRDYLKPGEWQVALAAREEMFLTLSRINQELYRHEEHASDSLVPY